LRTVDISSVDKWFHQLYKWLVFILSAGIALPVTSGDSTTYYKIPELTVVEVQFGRSDSELGSLEGNTLLDSQCTVRDIEV
jgi:hypothetical protein